MWVSRAKYNELVRENKRLREDIKNERRSIKRLKQIKELSLSGILLYLQNWSDGNLEVDTDIDGNVIEIRNRKR